MGFHPLVCHSAATAPADTALLASLSRYAGSNKALLSIRLSADLLALDLPSASAKQQRRDELWRASCCELFIKVPGEPAYTEWNFSPNGDWQCYQFSAYREGRKQAAVSAPKITVRAGERRCEFDAEMTLPAGAVQAATTMVIKNRLQQLSYWAMHHAATAPDFHHPAGFVLDCPAC